MQTDLARAAEAFLAPDRGEHGRRCFTGLEIEAPEELLGGVRALQADLVKG